jgi:hypothetical protein
MEADLRVDKAFADAQIGGCGQGSEGKHKTAAC